MTNPIENIITKQQAALLKAIRNESTPAAVRAHLRTAHGKLAEALQELWASERRDKAERRVLLARDGEAGDPQQESLEREQPRPMASVAIEDRERNPGG